MSVLAVVILLSFGIGLATGSFGLALATLVAGGVVLFIMAIAYMRPHGQSPEHHPPGDRFVDDTAP